VIGVMPLVNVHDYGLDPGRRRYGEPVSDALASDAPAEAREPGPRTRRRPRNSLSREVILRTAMDAFRGQDLGSLTFQALGRHLSAHPTAIYRHFRDKDDLLLAMLDALHGEALAEMGPPKADWADELRSMAASTYAVFRRYPAIAHHMATRTTRREHEFAIVDRIIGALRRSGLTDAEAARHLRPFADLVIGYSALDASLDALPPQERAGDLSAWDVDYRHRPAGQYPDLTSVAPQLTAVGDPANFRLAVELHIEAITHRVAAGGADQR
jgi:AcrR family transcriptional regulator